MEENIRFKYQLKNGNELDLNVGGVQNIFEAAEEIRSSILHGDLGGVQLGDVVKIEDVPG